MEPRFRIILYLCRDITGANSSKLRFEGGDSYSIYENTYRYVR